MYSLFFFFFFVPPSLSCSVIPIMMCARRVVWEVCGLSLGSGGQIASYFSRHISSASATLGVPGVLWPDASLRLGSRLLLVLTGFSSSLHQKSQWRDNPLFVFSHCIQTNIENRYFLLFLLFKRFLWRYWLICAYCTIKYVLKFFLFEGRSYCLYSSKKKKRPTFSSDIKYILHVEMLPWLIMIMKLI